MQFELSDSQKEIRDAVSALCARFWAMTNRASVMRKARIPRNSSRL